jgi:NitT/TauT family transport system permease protein
VIGLLRYLPASAFIPLLIIWLGLGEPSKVAILFIGTVFFNTLMTADVVRLVPGALIDVSYTLGARRGEVLRKVVVPHALPGMIDAIRVNAAAAWNFVVVAELIAAESGLGYRIARAQRFTQTDRIFAMLVVIGVIGLALDVTLRLLRDRVGRWV